MEAPDCAGARITNNSLPDHTSLTQVAQLAKLNGGAIDESKPFAELW